MIQEKRIIALTCLLVVLPIVVTEKCPSMEDMTPCICSDTYSYLYLTCHGIDNEELVKVASNLRGRKVFLFTIGYSKLDFIPHDVFKGVEVENLVMTRLILPALTDKDEAFVGLEDHLEQLSLISCVFKGEWDWSVLRKLKKLKSLIFWDSLNKEVFGTDAVKASVSSSLERIYLEGSNISFISDHALDSFRDVSVLSLKNNKIKNVKRTMLPNPALKLNWLILSNNLMEQIPNDMFTNMPNLRTLDLAFNKILVLNEEAFSPVWKQLQYFYIPANPLSCNCSISWFLEKRYPSILLGECASPPELQGKKLLNLSKKDFMCNV